MYIKNIYLVIALFSFAHFSVSVTVDHSTVDHPTVDHHPTLGISTAKNATNITAVAEFVKDTIKSQPIVIFSKTYCPYCKMAKEVFDKLKQSYEAVEIDKREDAAAIQEVLEEITGAKTVPRVFLNGECIGGGTDVKALYENGKLEQMLQKA